MLQQVYDLLLVRTLYVTTVEYNMNTAVNLYVTITYRNIWLSEKQQIINLVVTPVAGDSE
jgi:hypothetical protein